MSEKFTGTIELTDSDGRTTISLDGESSGLTLGGNGSGTVVLKSSNDEESIRLDADSCSLELGGSQPGRVSLRDSLGRRTIRLDAKTGYAQVKGLAGDVSVGGRGEDGSLFLKTGDGQATVRLDAGASVEVGGSGQYGSLYLANASDKKMISMYGRSGEIVLYAGPRQESIRLSGETGNVHLGGSGHDGDLFLQNKDDETTIHLNGETGVVHIPNADCAEDFPVAAGTALEAGDVVVFDQTSALQRSAEAYDKRVAGVISGAGDTRPGIVLGRRQHRDVPSPRRGANTTRLPVALVGKVNCKVDARFGAIEVGDLLTTSPRPGHAMKAGDPAQSFGAVLGKALGALDAGDGMIPVLVVLR